jgi:hypothetical protein
MKKIIEIREQAMELIEYGDSKEKAEGRGMLRVLKEWQSILKPEYTNHSVFETSGEYIEEVSEFSLKLKIIFKYLPFSTVKGYYITTFGVDLNFEDMFYISGKFKGEDCSAFLKLGKYLLNINMHPYNEMGGFDSVAFEDQFKRLVNQIV